MISRRSACFLLPWFVWLAAGVTSAAIDKADRAVNIMDVDALKVEVADVALVDVRQMEVYLRGHIPPARPLDVDELARLVLGTPEPRLSEVIRLLQRVPVRRGKPIVVYDTASLYRQDGFVAWLLAYAGLPDVQVLDGSFAAWFRRKNLGVFQGHPRPMGRIALRAEDLHPRLGLRIDPGDIENDLPDGSVIVDVLPLTRRRDDTPLSPGQIHVGEIMDEDGFFLFPYHLEKLLASRGIDHESRLVLRGKTVDAAFAWVAFSANGFDAALVEPLREAMPADSRP